MSVTGFQRKVCRLLAAERRRNGESYIAGGVPLSLHCLSGRVSKDIDIFHDTAEALVQAVDSDLKCLRAAGLSVSVLHQTPTFVNAVVSAAAGAVAIQWVKDSAFRFFPLVEDDDFGLTAHPFDLATNKVLALGGRLEIRDWLDTIYASDHIQHLGLLIYAAVGKDPGFSPAALLNEAGRSSRYSSREFDELAFDGEPPDFIGLAGRWKTLLSEAGEINAALPFEHAGEAVMDRGGCLYRFSGRARLEADLNAGGVTFHRGRICGALPEVVPADR